MLSFACFDDDDSDDDEGDHDGDDDGLMIVVSVMVMVIYFDFVVCRTLPGVERAVQVVQHCTRICWSPFGLRFGAALTLHK